MDSEQFKKLGLKDIGNKTDDELNDIIQYAKGIESYNQSYDSLSKFFDVAVGVVDLVAPF